MSDDWMDELKAADAALQPTGAARDHIVERVRRTRRRRAVGSAIGVIASVSVAFVGATVVSGALDEGAEPGPSATEVPTATESAGPELFDCPELSKVHHGEPVIEDLAEQQTTVEEISGLVRNAWTVHHAEPTALGVVALVQGHVDFAKSELSEYGVSHVFPWDPSGPSVGLDEEGQISQAVNWIISPAIHDSRRAMRGVPGYAGIAFWRNRGGVLLLWREPIPSEILALAGVRPDGVEVFVEGVRYSAHDVRLASDRVIDAIRSGQVDAEWSSASGCGDGSGLEVGITPETLGDRRAELQEQLSEIAGMPVRVRAEQRPIELAGDAGR